MDGRTSYVLYFFLIWNNLIFVTGVRKDVCDRCVKIEDCPMFANMPIREQKIWLQQVPCDGEQNNGESSLFGFSPIAKGDYICCPNPNVWGIDQGDHQNNRPQELPKIRPNDNYKPHIQPGNNLGNPKPRPTNPNIFGGQQNGINNPNPYGRPSNNNPINPTIYGHPQSRPGGPDIFGYYPNGHNNNGVFGSQPDSINSGAQVRPNEPNIYGHNPNGPANQGVYDNQPYQYPGNGMNVLGNPGQNYPNNRYPNSQNLIQPGVMAPGNMQNQFTQRPNNYFGQQQPNSYLNNGIGNPFGRQNEAQQCPVQTSLPPDPSTGCCGQDMSDSDKITDLQSILNMYAPSNQHRPQNNWPQQNDYTQQQNYQPSRPYYPQGSKKRKRSTENTTSIPDTDIVLDDRIAGGKETELDQFPWTVLLKVTFDYGDKQSSFSCGGSLISPKYVLTAAHCIYEKDAKIADIELTLAEYDKSTFPRDCKMIPGEGKQCVDNIVMHAEDVIRHPQYDDDRLHNDIALVRLHGYAPYTRFIRSICLPPIDIDNPDFSNLPLAVAGWGRNGPYVTDIKQSTVVHLVPHDECEKSYPHLTRSHLCAAGRTGEDTCKGDSGGPLMMLYRGSYYVIGIVSGKRADSPCGSTVPSLYTNVFQYVQWIRNTIKN